MKKTPYILFTCMLCCLIYSCKNPKSEKEKVNLPTVLIFENAPSQFSVELGKLKVKMGTTQIGEIIFTDSNGLMQYFSPNRERDTLAIYCSSEYMEINHLYRALGSLYFYLKSGDTVRFTYDNNKYPVLKSYTSEQLTQQYNFCKHVPDQLSFFGFEPLTLLSRPYLWNIYKAKKNNKYIPTESASLYIPMDTVQQQAETYLQEYASLLEKLHNDNAIYSDFYNYYNYLLQTQNIYYKYYSLYYAEDLSQRTITNLNRIYDSYFNDAYSNYISYKHFVSGYIQAYMSIGFPVITKIKEGSYGSSFFDYRAVFDSISRRSDIPPKTYAYMLNLLLDDIMTYCSIEDIECYKDKYVVLTGDTLQAEKKVIEHGITHVKNNDIQLRDDNDNELTFKDLHEQCKGKVLYVDFWASWCAPCRAAMPEALKLRKEYAEKDVVFLYLALNDRENSWKSAAIKEQLNVNGISYFIVNSKSSKAIQELKVESIPRYILYDKKGMISHFRAPSPHGNEIREQLDRLLKE